MSQPLSVKTVIVPKGQNKYGFDVVRFTADYAASDLYDVCIGCYPPCQNDLKRVVIVSDPIDVPSPPQPPMRTTWEQPRHEIDLRKAYSGVCASGDPGSKKESLLDKLGTSTVAVTQVAHYWDV